MTRHTSRMSWQEGDIALEQNTYIEDGVLILDCSQCRDGGIWSNVGTVLIRIADGARLYSGGYLDSDDVHHMLEGM